jgi:hypothetical protein
MEKISEIHMQNISEIWKQQLARVQTLRIDTKIGNEYCKWKYSSRL